MGYRTIIQQIQQDAGISAFESEEAVGRLVEEITERLDFNDRMKLARELPIELQEIVYAVAAVPEESETDKDLFMEYMEKEAVTRDEAEEQVLTAWSAIRSIISRGLVRHFKAQLPASTAQLLA